MEKHLKRLSPGILFQAALILRVSTVDIKRSFQGNIGNLMTFGENFEGKGLFFTRLEVGSNKITKIYLHVILLNRQSSNL